MHLIQTIFKSEKDKEKIERLHIANSGPYIVLLNKLGFSFLFNHSDTESINLEEFNPQQKDYINLINEKKALISLYCDKHLEYVNEMEEYKTKGILETSRYEFKWGNFLFYIIINNRPKDFVK